MTPPAEKAGTATGVDARLGPPSMEVFVSDRLGRETGLEKQGPREGKALFRRRRAVVRLELAGGLDQVREVTRRDFELLADVADDELRNLFAPVRDDDRPGLTGLDEHHVGARLAVELPAEFHAGSGQFLRGEAAAQESAASRSAV